MGDEAPRALYLALLLMLMVSSLAARKLPIGQAAKMAGAWIGIFAGVFVLFAFRNDFSALGQRLRAEITGAEATEHGKEVHIPAADDGHFWVDATINGYKTRFLIDSGATVTTVSRNTADHAGLETGIRREAVETANGTIVMKKSRAETFRVGAITRTDFSIDVNDSDDINVIGMNFLSSLKRWSVEGDTLVLVS
jgi:aspartyl protease family protein